MALFHRFVDPTYYLFPGETFPGAPGGMGTIGLHTYDRVNVVSAGAGAGGSANADVQQPSGVNQYTYFVAFGQDATSLNVNRGFRAVFESLDVVDDILRTSLPKRASQSAAAPGANNVVVTGEVFVSDDPATPANELFYIVETATNRPIYNGTTRVVVTDVDTGVPGTIIGTTWATNPTVRFNTAVTVPYTLYYGTRTTYGRVAETENSAWWTQEVAASRVAIAGEGQGLHGLDERYRRATDISSVSPLPNTPGAGAAITRDGPAISLRFPTADWDASPVPDPWLAGVRALYSSYAATAFVPGHGGDIALMALTGARNTVSVNELSSQGKMRAVAASYIPRSISTSTLNGTTRTRIPAGAAATLNPGGVDVGMVELTAPSYFSDGTDNTAIYSEADVLLVDFGGGVTQSYIIELDIPGLTAVQARLLTLDGSPATFTANTAVTVTWYSSYISLGGSTGAALEYYQPRQLSANALVDDYALSGLKLIGPDRQFSPSDGIPPLIDVWSAKSLEDTRAQRLGIWGNGDIRSLFGLGGNTYAEDQDIDATGVVNHTFAHRSVFIDNLVTGATLHIDPQGHTAAPNTNGMGFSCISVNLTGAPMSNFTLNITGSPGVMCGTFVELFIENFGGGGQGLNVTLNWDSSFKFSDPADAQLGAANNVHKSVSRWRLTQILTISSTGPVYFVERLATYYL